MSIFPIDPVNDVAEEAQPIPPIDVSNQQYPVPDVARGVQDPNNVWVVLAQGYEPDPASPPVDLGGT